jgi:membrane-associated protease RseP (regulator of RpoE activity)
MSTKWKGNIALGLLLGGAAMWAHLTLYAAQAPAPQEPDLQKQVDDALKELDKLKKVVPDDPNDFKKQIEDVRQQMRQQLLQGFGNPIVIGQGFPPGLGRLNGQARWGIMLQRPTPVLVDQLRLSAGQGLVVTDVLPNSAAAKAGIVKHDILLEVNGKAVANDLPSFQRDVRDLKADTDVTVEVMRRGTKETIKGLRLPDAKGDVFFPPPFQPGFPPGPQIVFPQAVVQGNAFEAMSVQVSNGEFTVSYANAGMKVTVKGKRENGQNTPAEITIQDGDSKVTARSIDDVPERYRPTITRMLDRVK